MDGSAKPREIIHKEIVVDKILNTNLHVDGGWFWTKYSANPYLGCEYGCTYCFLRENLYGLSITGRETSDLADPFSQFIRVKINAADVLSRELPKVPKDIIVTGDYQPAERIFRISRKLLNVCLKNRFPTLVIAKSPLVLLDADVILKIAKSSWACVVFSIASSKSLKYAEFFEPYAPSAASRFAAMKRLSAMGIYVGTALMPILPFITDCDENLEAIVRLTKENGGRFVLAGGLVLGSGQVEPFYKSLAKYDQELPEKYGALYGSGFSPKDATWAVLGTKVKKLCQKYGLDYRIRRFIPNSPLAINKKVSEYLFLRAYDMELVQSPKHKIEQFRQLAWLVDEAVLPITEMISKKRLIPGDQVILKQALAECSKSQ